MIDFIIGLIGLLFFGGGLMHSFLNKREELNSKIVLGSLVLIGTSIFLIFNSDVLSGKTIEMITGEETFGNKDTIVAGDYEYTFLYYK